MFNINITSEPLNVSGSLQWIQAPDCGAINAFIGTVRDASKGRSVSALEFEAYEKMAMSELFKIAEEAKRKWSLNRVLIHHRIGTLLVGEIAVLILVSCPHRNESFESCSYIIDTLKQTVPIWKKEIYEDGSTWIDAHP